jgi:hypothetical protein
MVNPISSSQPSHANEAAKPAAPKPQQGHQAQKSAQQTSGTAAPKSTGDAKHDVDSK